MACCNRLSSAKARRANSPSVAGGRRLQALQSLVESGRIEADYAVPCQVVADDADATEISLAENAVREDMHPADEFEAFRDLIDKGMPAADIAARFGVTETVVMQRLKLARVSPAVLKAYRDEKLTLEQVMAFAVVRRPRGTGARPRKSPPEQPRPAHHPGRADGERNRRHATGA